MTDPDVLMHEVHQAAHRTAADGTDEILWLEVQIRGGEGWNVPLDLGAHLAEFARRALSPKEAA